MIPNRQPIIHQGNLSKFVTHTKLLHARTNLTLPFGLFMLNRRLLGCGYRPRFRIRDLLLRLGTAPGTKISISEPRSLQS